MIASMRPRKRVAPRADHLSRLRRLTYRLRQIVRRRSFASLRLCKAIGSIRPYRYEMTFWHGILRLIGEIETRLSRRSG